MMGKNNQHPLVFRAALILFAGLSTAAVNQYWQQVLKAASPGSRSWQMGVAGWVGLGVLGVVILAALLFPVDRVFSWLDRVSKRLPANRWLGVGLLVMLALVFGGLYFGIPRYMRLYYIRTWAYALVVLAGVLALQILAPSRTLRWRFFLSALLFGSLAYFLTYFSVVSTYPLSLGWSETSRFFYASTIFSERVYGVEMPLPPYKFTRYLMQSLPFLIPNSPLWLHRLWQALMQAGFPMLAAWLLMRRLQIEDRAEKALFYWWAVLYLLQGPVFYQMLVMVVLMFGLFSLGGMLVPTLVVAAASLWAGLTQINWVPVPGMLAAAFYLISTPAAGKGFKHWLRYLLPPAVWVLAGGAVGLAARSWYTANSGWHGEIRGSVFSSALLWERLLPNPSYRLGILTGIALVALPLLIYLAANLKALFRRVHWLRLLGLGGMLVCLFAGGLVVSVKIGGGTNLHNLDAFMVFLLVFGASLFFGLFRGEDGETLASRPAPVLLAVILLVPVYFASLQARPAEVPPVDYIKGNLSFLQNYMEGYAGTDQDILFVTERQLPMFGYVEGVAVVPEYEKLFLMEMAMGESEYFLNQLTQDLETHRFSVIVTEKISLKLKDPAVDALAAENNAFYEHVAIPLGCSYKSVFWLQDAGIELWVPRTDGGCEQ